MIELPPHTPIVLPTVKPNGHWIFPETMRPDKHAGFVYAIIDLVMGMGYIGKKNYRSMQQARKVPSDWKTYCSSSNTLKLLFQHRPKSEFEFICIEEYANRGDLAYAESWSLFQVKALESNYWYNRGIESVGWKVKTPPTARHREHLDMVYERIHG
jgi:hypothetical protein